MRKYKAIVKRPDEAAGHMTNISTSLENLQRIVGGYIETVYFEDIVIICNEEGKIRGLEPSFKCGNDVICGTVAVMSVDGEEFGDVRISLPEWREILRRWGNGA